MALLLLLQVTAWFVALLGAIVGNSVYLPPIGRLRAVLSRLTPLTGTAVLDTATTHLAVLPPSCVVTVISAVPAATPVTRPPLDTDAMALLLLAHTTFWFVA
jgi:hypothetical protein